MGRIALWGAAVISAVGIAIGSAAGTASATVTIPAANDELVGVACPSTTSCIAVGANFTAPTPLAETWGALGWRTVGVKLPAGFGQGELTDVACPAVKSGADCVAVGGAITKAGTFYALADGWNGKAWTPVKASGSAGTILQSVSCPSVSYCLAVGAFGSPSGTGHPIADVWNGKKWAQIKVPAPAHATQSEFDHVSCASASLCMAVGEVTDSAGNNAALAAEWNGKTWSYLKLAPAPGLFDVDMSGVSCPTATSCVAVGDGAAKVGTADLIEVWNGKSWARASAVAWPKGSTNSWLVGLSCWAVGHCLSTGFIDFSTAGVNPDSKGRVAAALWNGKSWVSTPLPAPGAGKATKFDDVTCKSASFCVSVGLAATYGAPHGQALSGFWNGKSWKLVGAK